MKTIMHTTTKSVIILLSLALIPLSTIGQVIGDTVIFYVDQQIEVKIAIPDYYKLGSNQEIPKELFNLRVALPTLSSELSPDRAESIFVSPEGTVTVNPGNPTIVYQKVSDGLVNTSFRDLAKISTEEYDISVTAQDITVVSDVPLEEHLARVVDRLPEKALRSRTLYYECKGEIVTELTSKHITNPPVEFLELEIGAGAGLVRNEWVTDFSFGLGIGFNKKGAYRYPYLSSNMIFDFGEDRDINVNTFLNLGYGWSSNKLSTRNDRLYAEVGYLISRQGDLFEENTFKFGFKWSPVKGVYVNPLIYVSDGFSNIFPGVRVGFGF